MINYPIFTCTIFGNLYQEGIEGNLVRLTLVWRKKALLFICLVWFLIPGYSQNSAAFSVAYVNQPIKSILTDLEHLTNYEFAYSDSNLDTTQLISFSLANATLQEVLDQLCLKTNFSTQITGKKILFYPNEKPNPIHVEGMVIDHLDKTPIQGVHVLPDCNKTGTITDQYGKFVLTLTGNCTKLHLSYIGYKAFDFQINTDTIVVVQLEEEIVTLKESVVVAFGEEQQETTTGSVSTIDPSVYSQINEESVLYALQGESTGVLVQQNAGSPGSGLNIFIRGIGSITAGSQPLYLVDGVPMVSGNFSQLDFSGQIIDATSDLSVNDIESITILKDAAAASLYGSRASNGVILINTKRGIKNQNFVEFSSSYGLQQRPGKLNLLNSNQYMNYINEEALASGNPVVYSPDFISSNTIDTDWQDEVFRVVPTYTVNLALRGGTEKSTYYISGNHFNQEGIVIGSDYRRYNLRMNYDYQISKKLKIESSNHFVYAINNRIEGDQTLNGPLPNAISMPPVFPVKNDNGSYNNDGPWANPVAIAELEKNLAYTFRNSLFLKVNYELSKNLKLISLNGLDNYYLREQTFAPKSTRQGAKYNGLGIEATSNTLLINSSSYLDYNKKFGLHNLDAILGFGFELAGLHSTFLRAQNFPGTSFEFLQDAATPVSTSSYESNTSSNSLFARIKYAYDQKYFLTASLRRDGSSKFGSNNRFGFFPSFSGIWFVSNEDFFRSNSISKLKFSISYGLTGNDQIENYKSLDIFSAGSNYNGEGGISPLQMANPNLKWETTQQLNFGGNIEFFDKLNVQLDFYHKNTTDLLLEKPMPPSSGFQYILSNVGKLKNTGIEATVSALVINRKLSWQLMMSLAANRNTVTELYKNLPIRNIGRASSSIETGMPVSYFYGFNSLGVDPATGNLIYEDRNNDGMINDLDKTYIGSPHPDFFGSASSSLSYKNFNISLLIIYSYGNEIFNSTRIYTESFSLGNKTTAVLDRWQKPGDQTAMPKSSAYNKYISSRFVEDGSFIKLKNLKIDYSLSDKALKTNKIKEIHLYFMAKNLLTFTRYSGYDPEVNYSGGNSIVLGTDFFTYPNPITYTIGVCAKF